MRRNGMPKMGKEFRFAKPGKDGLMVRFPRTMGVLPEEGAIVPWTGTDGKYWRRRLAVGDIVLSTQTTQKKDSYYDNAKKIDDVLGKETGNEDSEKGGIKDGNIV